MCNVSLSGMPLFCWLTVAILNMIMLSIIATTSTNNAGVNAFVPSCVSTTPARTATIATTRKQRLKTTTCIIAKQSQSNDPIFYNDFDGFDDDDDKSQKPGDDGNNEDDDDEIIDADTLGDWRAVRQKLLTADKKKTTNNPNNKNAAAISKQNQQLLAAQNKQLAEEYSSYVWAHETATPEVGGLLVRLPLEVELRRNHRHSRTGEKLRRLMESQHLKLDSNQNSGNSSIQSVDNVDPIKAKRRALESIDTSIWYHTARKLIEDEMKKIAEKAQEDGQIDASTLNEDSSEVLQLYLEQQETWQEVCLVLEMDERKKTASTVVINRPMALQLTDSLGKLVLNGTFRPTQPPPVSMKDFLRAFGGECAVYVGGPDLQHEPALLVHGIAGLDGSTEISPGIYQGGIAAAVKGVLSGLYQPLDFRFFVGRRNYSPQPISTADSEKSNTTLELAVYLGKYQPVACARSLALKQCIQLPKPLWHEVLDMCGGDLAHISKLELSERDDMAFQIVSDEDDDDDETYFDDDDDEFDIIVLDEGDEFDDDDDDDE